MVQYMESPIKEQLTLFPDSEITSAPVHHWRRVFRTGSAYTAIGLMGAIGGGMGGATMDSTAIELGPHEAEATLTLDGDATLDLGPLGSIIKPLDSTHGVGVRVDLKEVNESADTLTPKRLQQLAGFYGDIEGDIADARTAMVLQFLKYASLGGAGAIGLLARERRRQQFLEAATRPAHRRVALGVAGAGLFLSACSYVQQEPANNAQLASDVFDNTPLEGTHIKGLYLQTLVNDYGADVMRAYAENDAFYDTAAQNMREAFETQAVLQPTDGQKMIFFYTDLHCNPGMGEVIEKATRLIKPNVVVKGGDETWSGSSYEQMCVRVVADMYQDAEVIDAPGNHDSDKTEKDLEALGDTVLDGKIVQKNDLTFLGDDDPRRSEFMKDIQPERGETLEQMGHRLAEAACETPEGVDVLVVHDKHAAGETALRGCARLILSGHSHDEEISTVIGPDGQLAWHLTGASAGGAEGATIGPLEHPAVFYLIAVHDETGQPELFQRITVNSDATVIVDLIEHIPAGPVPSLSSQPH